MENNTGLNNQDTETVLYRPISFIVDSEICEQSPAAPVSTDFEVFSSSTATNAEEGLALKRSDVIATEQELEQMDWTTVRSSFIHQAMHHNFVRKPVKIVATISAISAPKPVVITQSGTLATRVLVTLRDRLGSEIKCFPLSVDKYDGRLMEMFLKKQHCVFCGTIYPKWVGGVTSLFMFSVKAIQHDVSAEDLIAIIDDGDKTKEVFIEASKEPGGIRAFIKRSLVENLAISGLQASRELDKCIDFMILQAFSDGMQNNFSMKLHSLILGPPASGKKILVDVARVLNPVFEKGGHKITPAGLIGKVEIRDDRSVSEPGHLPRASGGVFCLEDAHNISGHRKLVFAALAEVMENGVVTDSTSARTVHEANTAIHLDMNRVSQVDPGAKVTRFTDVEIYLNVISRFDFIMEIPPDPIRQFRVSDAMLRSAMKYSSSKSTQGMPIWERRLQRIIAYVRTAFPSVNISSEVSNYMASKFQGIVDANKEYIESTRLFILQSNAARMAHSLQKLVVACVRAGLRSEATKHDVDEAFLFVAEKLRFLKSFEESLNVPDFALATIDKSEWKHRQDFITERFAGQTVSASAILEALNHAKLPNIPPISRMTLYRDLQAIKATKAEGKKWHIE